MARNNKAFWRFHRACHNNNLVLVQLLFDNQVVDAKDATMVLKSLRVSIDPLSEQQLAVARCLLENGADPNAIDPGYISSLAEMKLLAEFGYDVKSRGHVRLHTFSSGYIDFPDKHEFLDWLLDQGVSINYTEEPGPNDVLHPGGRCKDWSVQVLNRVAMNGDIKLFDYLVARGAIPSKSLALHTVSWSEHVEQAAAMASHLLDYHGMDINADNDDLRECFHNAPDAGTPLCAAIYDKNLAVVEVLLRKGAGVRRCGRAQRNPLSNAIGDSIFPDGFLPALRPLLAAGADADDALSRAVTQTHADAAKICLEFGADPRLALVQAREQEQERLDKEAESPGDECGTKKSSALRCKALMEVLESAAL